MTSAAAHSHRDRQRGVTAAEIKEVARGLLVTGGPAAVSMRAIAREMNLTAPALYRYFPSLEALVGALCADLFGELRATIAAARDATPDAPARDRVVAMARAFRDWGRARPAEFGLLLGPSVPGLTPTWEQRGTPGDPTAWFGAAFLAEFADLHRQLRFPLPSESRLESDLAPQLSPFLAEQLAAVPLPVVYVFLSAWSRLYGLVAMEVFGHFDWALADPTGLFELELSTFVNTLTGIESG